MIRYITKEFETIRYELTSYKLTNSTICGAITLPSRLTITHRPTHKFLENKLHPAIYIIY